MVATDFIGELKGLPMEVNNKHSAWHRISTQEIPGVPVCRYKVDGKLDSPIRFLNPFQHLNLPMSLLYSSQGLLQREFDPLALLSTQHDTAFGFSTELCWDQVFLQRREIRTSSRAGCQGGSAVLFPYSCHHISTVRTSAHTVRGSGRRTPPWQTPTSGRRASIRWRTAFTGMPRLKSASLHYIQPLLDSGYFPAKIFSQIGYCSHFKFHSEVNHEQVWSTKLFFQ